MIEQKIVVNIGPGDRFQRTLRREAGREPESIHRAGTLFHRQKIVGGTHLIAVRPVEVRHHPAQNRGPHTDRRNSRIEKVGQPEPHLLNRFEERHLRLQMGRLRPACRNTLRRNLSPLKDDVVRSGRRDSGEREVAARLLRVGEFQIKVGPPE